MAITIVATAGGSTSNSFVTLAEMTTHMEGRLNSSDFDDATADNQNRALAEATRWLDAVTWQGYRVTATQALSWPRQWAYDPDSPVQDYYATTVVPERLKRATYELAFAFLVAGTTDIAALDSTDGIKRKKIDVLETEYWGPGGKSVGLAKYPAVTREIGPLMAGSAFTSEVVKG